MDLLALSDFNLVARHGGFARAAQASGRPKATLSRRVAELEASLGVRLFERNARRARLTEEGQALHERTRGLLVEIEEAAAGVAAGGSRPQGLLRVSAPLLFAQAAMGRLAAGYVLAHPEMRIEVTAEDRTADLVEDKYDLAIRVNPRRSETLVGRCFLRDRTIVVAAPSLRRPAKGEAARAIVLASPVVPDPVLVETADGSEELPFEPLVRLSSWLMVRDAVRCDAGAAVVPQALVGHDMAKGRLVSWGNVVSGDVELWALHTTRRLLSAKVAAFQDHLARSFPKGTWEELAAMIDGEADFVGR